MPMTDIRYLLHEAIDKSLWDSCLFAARNGLIYGTSAFLDTMTNGRWNALVLRNYEAVMPLPYRRKAGITYLYQPAYTQQLGVFCRVEPSPGVEKAFRAAAEKYFSFAEIYLNYLHATFAPAPGNLRANYLISLNRSYPEIRRNYKHDFEKNVRRAQKHNLFYCSDISIQNLIADYYSGYGNLTPHISNEDNQRFNEYCKYAEGQGNLMTRGCRDGAGQLLSAVLLLRYRDRYYNMMSVQFEAGRKAKSNHFLYDSILAEIAGQDAILDLEGSDLPGVAHFYQIMGGVNQPFLFCRWNHLPAWIKWIKG